MMDQAPISALLQRRLWALGFTLWLLLSSTPSLAANWQTYASYRATGGELSQGLVEKHDLVRGKIRRDLHYVSLALETVFVRDLPGFSGTTDVVLGLEVEGLLPEGKVLQAITDVQSASGESVFFDNALALDPVVYSGRSVTVTLHFRSVSREAAAHFKGRISTASDLLKKYSLTASDILSEVTQVFAGVMGTSARASWKYSFTLHPAEGVIHDKPENLLTAARHILVALPPLDAPRELRHLTPSFLARALKLTGNRLVWRESERLYSETPYLILNVLRHRRYPRFGTEIQKTKRDLEQTFALGNLARCEEILFRLGAAIAGASGVTVSERNYELDTKEMWALRIQAARARAAQDPAREADFLARELAALASLKENYIEILEEADHAELDQALRRTRAALGSTVPPDLSRRVERALALRAERRRLLAEEEERVTRLVTEPEGPGTPALRVLEGGWVEAEAQVPADPGTSEEILRSRARDAARRLALSWRTAGALGHQYIGGGAPVPFQNRQVVSPLSDFLSPVIVLDEKVLKEEALSGTGYRSRLRLRLGVRAARTDPGYEVRLEMSRRDLSPGDEVDLRIAVNRDSYVYLFGIGASGEVVVLSPNPFEPTALRPCRSPRAFPDRDPPEPRGQAHRLPRPWCHRGQGADQGHRAAPPDRSPGRRPPLRRLLPVLRGLKDPVHRRGPLSPRPGGPRPLVRAHDALHNSCPGAQVAPGRAALGVQLRTRCLARSSKSG
jgi:hypothetical protein